MDEPRWSPKCAASYVAAGDHTLGRTPFGIMHPPPRPESMYAIDPRHALSIDLDLAHPPGDCDPPRNWPKGVWIADFLLSTMHPAFHFDQHPLGSITVGVEDQSIRRYLVLARHPFSGIGDPSFAICSGEQRYHGGYETLHFADKCDTVVTTGEMHSEHRAALAVVVQTLEQRLDAIRKSGGR